ESRGGVRAGGADVPKVDVLPVDRGGELRVLVEGCLPGAPVVLVLPVVDQVADVADGDAVLPARRDRAPLRTAGVEGEPVGPAGPGQPVGEVVQVGLGHVNEERANLLAGVAHGISPSQQDVCRLCGIAAQSVSASRLRRKRGSRQPATISGQPQDGAPKVSRYVAGATPTSRRKWGRRAAAEENPQDRATSSTDSRVDSSSRWARSTR